MTDGVTVDLQALTTFAQNVSKLADDQFGNAAGWGANLAQMSQMIASSSPMQSMFNEANRFAAYHQIVAASAQQFLIEAVEGVACLGAGAESCAISYASTEQFNAAMFDQIDGAGAGLAKLNPTLTGQGAITAGDVDAAFSPGEDQGMPWNNPVEPSSTSDAPVEPLDREQQNQIDSEFNQQLEQYHQEIVDGEAPDGAAGDLAGEVIGQGDTTIRISPDGTKLPELRR
jgi:hypothetical protein